MNSEFSFSQTGCHIKVRVKSALLFTHSWRKNSWIYTFLKGIMQKKVLCKIVVLGWMISLSVEPGIEPGIFRFQSKVLATPLLSLRSSSTFLLFFLSLSLSLLLLSFLFPLLLLAEKNSRQKKKKKKKTVGFYSRHSTHNPFP